MKFLVDRTDEEYYENISRTIPDGNVMKMYLIIMEGKYGAIDRVDYSSYGYYIIRFSPSLYTLQADLSIDGQVISSGGIVCEGTYFFPIIINYHYYVLQKNKSINTIFSLMTIINGDINVICCDLNDVVPQCLMSV